MLYPTYLRRSDPFAQAELLFGAILGQGARLPGQSRHRIRARSLADGISLTDDELAGLDARLRA